MKRVVCAVAGVMTAVVLSWLGAAASEREVDPAEVDARPVVRAPNVLLISIDTLRSDRLSCYGASRRTSPNIDALAARGVRFANAFSPTSWTLPAHAAMFTGRYPSTLSSNLEDPGMYASAPLLATMLRRAGYMTAAFTGGIYLSAQAGADEGFETFVDQWPGLPRRAVQWLRGEPRRPFFLFFHTYVVHIPYRDRRFVDGLDPGRLADIFGKRGGKVHEEFCQRGAPTSQNEKDFLLALYDGGVARADEMVGELVDALAQKGLEDNTIVIVTSDHGEEFWEHTGRCAYHGHTLYDEMLHVPLVWYDPQGTNPGLVVEAPVSLVDIVPTLLRRLGLDAPGGLDGIDLNHALAGKGWIDRVLFGESIKHGPARWSVRSPAAKLIVTPDPEAQQNLGKKIPVSVRAPRELYLATDQAEADNVADEQQNIARGLTELLDRHREARATTGSAPSQHPGFDDRTKEQLRALGYIE